EQRDYLIGFQTNRCSTFFALIDEPHFAFKNIRFHTERIGLFGFKPCIEIRKILQCFEITVELVIQATLQLSALTCEFLWIDRQLLISCSGSGYRPEIGEPGDAAQFPPTRSNPSNTAGFLPGSDLSHFNPHFKTVC